jgi:hypothetical protein
MTKIYAVPCTLKEKSERREEGNENGTEWEGTERMREGAETNAQLPSLSLSLSCSVRVDFSFCITSANF